MADKPSAASPADAADPYVPYGTAAAGGSTQVANPYVATGKGRGSRPLYVRDDWPKILPVIEGELQLLESHMYNLIGAIIADDD